MASTVVESAGHDSLPRLVFNGRLGVVPMGRASNRDLAALGELADGIWRKWPSRDGLGLAFGVNFLANISQSFFHLIDQN